MNPGDPFSLYLLTIRHTNDSALPSQWQKILSPALHWETKKDVDLVVDAAKKVRDRNDDRTISI